MSKSHRRFLDRISSSSSEEDETVPWNPSKLVQYPNLPRQNFGCLHGETSHPRQRSGQELVQPRAKAYIFQGPRDACTRPQPKKARMDDRCMVSPPRGRPCGPGSHYLGHKSKSRTDDKWKHDKWQWQDDPLGNKSAQPNNRDNNSREKRKQNPNDNNFVEPDNWGSNSCRPTQNPNNNSAQPNDWGSSSREKKRRHNSNDNNSAQPNDWDCNSRRPIQNPNNSAQPNDWGSSSREKKRRHNSNDNNSAQPNDWDSSSRRPIQNPNNSAQPNDWGSSSQEKKHRHNSNDNNLSEPNDCGSSSRRPTQAQPNNWGNNSRRPPPSPNSNISSQPNDWYNNSCKKCRHNLNDNTSVQPNDWGNTSRRPPSSPNSNNSTQLNDWDNSSCEKRRQNPNGNNTAELDNWGSISCRPTQNLNNKSAQPKDWGSSSHRPTQNPNNKWAQPNDWDNSSQEKRRQNPNDNSVQHNDWGNTSCRPPPSPNSNSTQLNNRANNSQPKNLANSSSQPNNSSQTKNWANNSQTKNWANNSQTKNWANNSSRTKNWANNSSQTNNWANNSQTKNWANNSQTKNWANNSSQTNNWRSNSRRSTPYLNSNIFVHKPNNFASPLPKIQQNSQASESVVLRPASPIKYKIVNSPELIPGTRLLVKPTVVSSLDNLYVWLEQSTQQLDSLQSQVATACQPGGTAGTAEKLEVGDACLVKHLSVWFRATVLAKPSKGLVNVLLCDYGDQINVDLSTSVKAITEQLAKPYAFAIHCSLRGATPKMGLFWNPDEIVLFLNTVSDKVLQASLVAVETTQNLNFSVVLYDGEICINQIFGATPEALLPSMSLPEQPSPAGNAVVKYFVNPGLFSLHLTCQKYNLSNIERQIGEVDRAIKLRTVALGDLVLAPRDNAYHRARVSHVKAGHAKCSYLDLGVTNLMRVVNVCDLLPMPESLKNVAPLRYDVKLAGIEPVNGLQWAAKCLTTDEIFRAHADFEMITAVRACADDLWQVELKQPATTSTLSELLIAARIANKSLPGTFAAGGLLKVFVSYFQTMPTLFHLQEKSKQMDLEALQANLQALNLGQAEPHIPVFGSGTLAAARSPEDHEWYRVLPMFMKEDKVSVYFVDYGNQDIVSELRELPSDLAKPPYFSVPCRLPVKPNDSDTFSTDTLAMIEDLLFKEEQSVTAQIYCKDDRAIMVGDVLVGEKSLSEMLITQKLATSIILSGYVSSVTSQHSFYIHLLEDAHKLGQMEEQLAKEEFEKQERVIKGRRYIAKFKDDNAWYRAKVMEISTEKVVTVLFYDYGNTTVATEFKKMPADMKNIPVLATHCALHLLPSTQVEIDKFLNSALDGSIQYKFVLMKEGNGTTEVVLLKDDIDLIPSNFELTYPVGVDGPQLTLSELAPSNTSGPTVSTLEPTKSAEKADNPSVTFAIKLPKKVVAPVEPKEIPIIDLESPEPSPGACEVVDTSSENMNAETVDTPTSDGNINTETVGTSDENISAETVGTSDENMNAETVDTSDENINTETVGTSDGNMNAETVDTSDENMNAETVGTSDENMNAETVDTSDENMNAETVDTSDENINTETVGTSDENMNAETVDTSDENMNAETVDTSDENMNAETVDTSDENMNAETVDTSDENRNAVHGNVAVPEVISVEIETSDFLCQQEPEKEQQMKTDQAIDTSYQSMFKHLQEIHQTEDTNDE